MANEYGLAESELAHKAAPKKVVPAPKKEVHKMTVEKAAGKGYVVEHEHKHPAHKNEKHAVPNKKALLAHVDQHMPEEATESPNEAQDEAVGIQPEE